MPCIPRLLYHCVGSFVISSRESRVDETQRIPTSVETTLETDRSDGNGKGEGAVSETRLVLDLSWEQHIEEFTLRLREQIWIGNATSYEGYVQYESFGDPGLDECWLVAERDNQGHIVCTLTVDTGKGEAARFRLLRRAVQTAAARTGRSRRASWQAVIGPVPQPGTTHPALAAACRVGDLRLLPARWLLRETVADRPHLLTGRAAGEMVSWPVIVQGHTASYGEYRGAPIGMWPMDEIAAARTAQQAASMLSLAWRYPWIVRVEPVRIRAGTRMPAPDGATATTTRPKTTTRLPAWVEPAWTSLAADADLASALAAWAQATQLQTHHPSAAAVLYTALIEGIGARDHELTRCPTCRAQQGATERFRAALRRVLPADQAKNLTRTVYSLRSQTAHTGRLHGAETELGWLPDDFYQLNTAAEFEEQTLTALVDAARRVLIHVLAGQDEPAQTIP
jgi:hypothetical protein